MYNVENINFIDLGLSKSILWATCNVGTSSPEEEGQFFS